MENVGFHTSTQPTGLHHIPLSDSNTAMKIVILTAPKCSGKTCLTEKLVVDGLCKQFDSDKKVIQRMKELHGYAGTTFDEFLPVLQSNLDDVERCHENILGIGDSVIAEGFLYCYRKFRKKLYLRAGNATVVLVELRPTVEEMTRGLLGRKEHFRSVDEYKKRKRAEKSLLDWARFEPPDSDELLRLQAFKQVGSRDEALLYIQEFFGK